MPSIKDLKQKTIAVTYDYFGTPIIMNAKVDFFTSEVENRVQALSANPEKMTTEEQQKLKGEFADILGCMVESWDIEDAQPTTETFSDLGILFLIGAFGAITGAILPKNPNGNTSS